jgi:uncharacterized protein
MRERSFTIHIGEHGPVSVLETLAGERRAGSLLVYAPGAGSNIHDPFGAFCSRELAGAGIDTWRFQFPYMEAGRRGPDRPPVLEQTWLAVLKLALEGPQVTVAGGRSMGGRIASQVVAGENQSVAGLALFAYPLHPPGRPERLRAAHLPLITVPALLCSGTRDAFGSPDELTAAAALVPDARIHLLEGADHGFNVLKSSGRTRSDVWREAVTTLLDFIRSLDRR